ncbi:ABC transporter substrate-binding protein [Streptomyces monticola]|uniref:ABC transporter substrate-binding protein n=1 Tax=Streptomyces monticola TaxID=2666263 RepID=A0ABW2JNX8_9ACTN
MRSVGWRILAMLVVLATAGAGAWQLLPAGGDAERTITVGTTDAVTSLDPAGAYDAGSWALYSNVFQTLLTFEPGGVEPVPDAAERCGFIGPKAMTYRCTLRTGLSFPSGRAVTARDVKHSFDRLRKIHAEVGPAPLFGGLRTVEAAGRTVTFRLAAPDATFPHKLATGAASIVDRTKYPDDALRTGTRVDGTGPYTLASYSKGERAELRPNSRYRGADRGNASPAVLRYYKDSAALAEAWDAGRLDVAARQLPPALVASLSPASKDIRVTEVGSAEIRNLVLNTRKGSPLHDRRVRQAVAALVDRGELAERTYHGTVEPLYSLVPSGITGHTVSFFDTYPQPDRARAERLLREAGARLPVRLSFAYSRGSATTAEAALLKKQLEKSGLFEVDTAYYEWSAFQAGYAKGDFDAYAVGWFPDFPDPDTYAAPLVGSGGTLKNGYRNPDVDRLILASQRYDDRGRSTEDFRRLQDIVARDVPLVPLWQRKEYVLSGQDISGGQYLSDGTGAFRVWELGWI